jgi:hypothetical protein
MIKTSDIAPNTPSFDISVDWHRECTSKDKINRIAFLLQEIFAKGVVSENACKPKIERSVTPGTFVLFVREETFFEKMAH